MSDLLWRRVLVGLWFFAVVQLAVAIGMQVFAFAALQGVDSVYASFPPSQTVELHAIGPNLYLLSVAPDSVAYHEGARTGDILDASLLPPSRRFRIFSSFWWPGERVALTLRSRDGATKHIDLSAVRVPGTLDMWLANAGLAWMLLFAGFIVWRRPDTAQARVLSLLLILFNIGLQFQVQNWFTPLPLLDCALAALSCFPFYLSQTLFVTYANLFARPLSTLRKVLSFTAYAYALIIASVNALFWVNSATSGVSPVLYEAFRYAEGIAFALVLLPVLAGLFRARGSEREQLVWTSASLIPMYVLWIAVALPADASVERIAAIGINITLFLAPLGLTYSVLSKRLLDIGFTINRVAVYSVVSALVVGSFILVEYIVSEIMGTGRGVNLVVGAALALILGLSMRFIHKRVDRVLDEVFFRKRHEDEHAIRSFAREAEFITSEDVLLVRTRVVLEQHADASFIIIALDDGYGAYGKYDENDPAIVALRAWHKPVDLKTLDTTIHAEFAYPMIARGRLVGLVALGPKRSGENYAPDESEAIAQLARGVGVAVDTLRAAAPESSLVESVRSVAADIGEMKAMLRRAIREGLSSS
jgi:hypothetical protein